jgi:drug/metabolite transporter (DMT)-like permease
MGLIGVAGTQVAYFAAITRIPVSTALLIEYLSPLVLVGIVWVRTRRPPRVVVFIGSALAIGGLVLTIGPGSLGGGDGLGFIFAFIAMLGVVGYYLIAARPSNGLPPVAFASAGLLLGSLVLGVVGAVGVLPLSANFGAVPMGSAQVPWWVPLGLVALVGTAFAYVASIIASERLGSRLMSFVGLLEVVFASVFAWLLIGETLTLVQIFGGVLILGGIALVRMEREADVPLEPGSVDEDAQRATDTGAVRVVEK